MGQIIITALIKFSPLGSHVIVRLRRSAGNAVRIFIIAAVQAGKATVHQLVLSRKQQHWMIQCVLYTLLQGVPGDP